jgi:hypothetical protein
MWLLFLDWKKGAMGDKRAEGGSRKVRKVNEKQNRVEGEARVVGRRTAKGCLLEVRVEADESGISESPATIFNCSNRTALFCRSQR